MLSAHQISEKSVSIERYEDQIEKIAKGNALSDFTVKSITQEFDRVKRDQENLDNVLGDWTQLREAMERNVKREANVTAHTNTLFAELTAQAAGHQDEAHDAQFWAEQSKEKLEAAREPVERLRKEMSALMNFEQKTLEKC